MTDERENLLDRMKLLGERLIIGKKQQDLPYVQIVARIADFMLSQEKLRVAYAYGNEVGEDLEGEDDDRFDPIALHAAHPDNFDAIAMYVDAEMQEAMPELLERRSTSVPSLTHVTDFL